MALDPSDFSRNEAWLLFQLNEAPVQTEADGDFNAVALMDVATGIILGMELVPVNMPGLPTLLSRKLLADAESQAGSRPQKLFISQESSLDELAQSAEAMGIDVESVPGQDLSIITREARDGFARHVSGGKVH